MVWYGVVYVSLYSAIVTNVTNALCTLVPGKQPSFQALFEGAKVLLCAEVVGQRVPNHRAVHSKCSAANTGEPDDVSLQKVVVVSNMLSTGE